MSSRDANMERFSARASEGVAGCSKGCIAVCDECVDLELTEGWDETTVEALTCAGEERGMGAPAAGVVPMAQAVRQAEPVDRLWLDGRLAEIASNIEETLRRADPAPALGAFGARLDNFEARLEAAVVRADAREDRDSLRFIEAHVREIDVQLGRMRSQMARIDAIDARVGDMLDRLPAPGDGIEGLVEGAVSRAIAAANVLCNRHADGGSGEESGAMLGRIEDALGRLIERVEKIEQSGAREDPRRDAARLSAAYAEGARVLGLAPEGGPRASARSLHANDYSEARQELAQAQPDPTMASTLRSLLDPIEKALGSARGGEASPFDVQFGDLKASAARAKRRAQAEAEAAGHDSKDLRELPPQPRLQASPRSIEAPERIEIAAAAAAAAGARLEGIELGKRPLSKGRWNRGFFALLVLGGLGFGCAGFIVVDRMIGEAPGTPRLLAEVSSEPSQPATPVAQSTAGEKPGAAMPAALPPGEASELPGAAVRSSSLPATIASAALRHAAANGDPAAEFEIAARYAEGRGVTANPKEAFAWYHRAAVHGHVPAQFRLASHYEQGAGTDKDLERAKVWYRRAAERGHAKAMHNLGVLIASGRSKADLRSAADWFREAAERNLADSQYNLAVMYESGQGVEVNLAEAYKWYALAARSGDLEAERRLKDVRGQLSKGEIAAVERAVAEWMPRSLDGEAKAPAKSERASP